MWRMRSTFLCPWYEAFYFEQMDLAVWNQEIGSGSILKSYYASSSLIYSSLSTVGYHSPNSHSIWARNAQNLNGFFLMDKQTDWVIIRAWTVRNKIQCITYLLVCFLISEYVKGGGLFCVQVETEDTSMVIMDALMGHLHHIRVRAQDAFINHSQWSEWSQVVQAQPWSGEPYTHAQSYWRDNETLTHRERDWDTDKNIHIPRHTHRQRLKHTDMYTLIKKHTQTHGQINIG